MSSFLNLRFDNDSCQGTFFMDITFRSDWRGQGSGFKCSVSCRPAPSQSTPAPNPALSLPWSGCSCGRPNRYLNTIRINSSEDKQMPGASRYGRSQ